MPTAGEIITETFEYYRGRAGIWPVKHGETPANFERQVRLVPAVERPERDLP